MASKNLYATKLTANDSAKKCDLGTVRREWSTDDSCFKTYKYVQASIASQGNLTAGIPLAWYDVLGQVATNDISTTNSNLPAGVTIGALNHSYYGWIQIGGYCSSIKTNGQDDIADGVSILVDNYNDGTCDSIASGTAATVKILGIAVAADTDADNKVTAILDCSYGDIIQ